MKNLMTLLLLPSLFLMSCSASKDEKNQSSDQTYEFKNSYNGNECTTGVKKYNGTEELCKLLQDDKANNNCARDLRELEYKNQCGGPMNKTEQSPAPTPPIKVRAETPAPQTVPRQVLIKARINSQLESHKTTANNTLVSTISGKIKIASIDPQTITQLFLISASNVRILTADTNLDVCEKEMIKNFKSLQQNQDLDFTLIMADKISSEQNPSACSVFLTNIKRTGFKVEFSNVPVSQIRDEKVDLVTLEVSPEKPIVLVN